MSPTKPKTVSLMNAILETKSQCTIYDGIVDYFPKLFAKFNFYDLKLFGQPVNFDRVNPKIKI